MAYPLSLLSSYSNKTIHQYLMEGCHTGQISAVWFENDSSKGEFMEKMAEIKQLKDNLKILEVEGCNTEMLDSNRKDLDNQKFDVFVLDGENDTDEFQEWVMNLSCDYASSIFLLSDTLPTTYIADKVICVGKNGVVTDEFFTNMMA